METNLYKIVEIINNINNTTFNNSDNDIIIIDKKLLKNVSNFLKTCNKESFGQLLNVLNENSMLYTFLFSSLRSYTNNNINDKQYKTKLDFLIKVIEYDYIDFFIENHQNRVFVVNILGKILFEQNFNNKVPNNSIDILSEMLKNTYNEYSLSEFITEICLNKNIIKDIYLFKKLYYLNKVSINNKSNTRLIVLKALSSYNKFKDIEYLDFILKILHESKIKANFNINKNFIFKEDSDIMLYLFINIISKNSDFTPFIKYNIDIEDKISKLLKQFDSKNRFYLITHLKNKMKEIEKIVEIKESLLVLKGNNHGKKV